MKINDPKFKYKDVVAFYFPETKTVYYGYVLNCEPEYCVNGDHRWEIS